jgi:glycine C-acetyltransferase
MEKIYKYPKEDSLQISYETSAKGDISCEKYTLMEILGKPEIENLSISQRIDIVSSWSLDVVEKGLPFCPKVMPQGCSTEIVVKDVATGKSQGFINFGSNDYLNFSQHPEINAAAAKALKTHGGGSGASGVVTGITDIHHELHLRLAKFKGCQAAMVQPNGYVTNLGVITTLMGNKDLVLFDMYSHASLIDGVAKSTVNKVFFGHNDVNHLEFLLKRAKNDYVNKLIVIEGVYSMDGDIAPLDKIYELGKKYGAMVLIDEAHSVGVIGETGRGLTEHFGLMGKIDIVTGTFSKAFGSVGGYVAGSKEFINYLYWANRSFFFSTSMYIPCAAGILKAIDIIESGGAKLGQLWDNIRYVKNAAETLGLDTGTTNSAVIPIILGDERVTVAAFKMLQEMGIFCIPVTYPAVAKGNSRLRISLMAEHSQQQLDKLIEGLAAVSIMLKEMEPAEKLQQEAV